MNCKVGYSVAILSAFMLLAGCSINVNNGNSQYEYSEDFSFVMPVAQYDEISVDNINGNIEIVGVDSLNEVQVSGKKIVQDESVDEAKSHISDISIDILSSETALTIRTTQPNSSGGRTYQVDYEIQVPSGWKAMVTNINGTLEVKSIKNSVNATLTNGTLSANDITGDLRANLTNGNIDADVTLPVNSTCQLNTTNGNIVLAVPRSTSATVSASVVNGSVAVSDLSIALSSNSRTHLSGTMGKGESTISLSTVNGTIQLKSF